jgi:K+-transporting ATPase ATPase C chain
VVGIALVSLLLCGLLFPLLVTGIAQSLLPAQANGSIANLDGRPVGSYLIDSSFNSTVFFHSRANESASLVDPDIPLEFALTQVPRISSATGIPEGEITSIVERHVEGTYWIFGSPYVNVLAVNLALISAHPDVYNSTLTAP